MTGSSKPSALDALSSTCLDADWLPQTKETPLWETDLCFLKSLQRAFLLEAGERMLHPLPLSAVLLHKSEILEKHLMGGRFTQPDS